MKKLIQFNIPVEPMAVQSVRSRAVGNRVMHYQPARIVRWKSQVRAAIQAALPDDWELLDRPVAAKYVLKFPVLKSTPKKVLKQLAEGATIYKWTKPDSDNCVKGLKDCFNKLVWVDDALVVDERSQKIFSLEPCMEVTIYDI